MRILRGHNRSQTKREKEKPKQKKRSKNCEPGKRKQETYCEPKVLASWKLKGTTVPGRLPRAKSRFSTYKASIPATSNLFKKFGENEIIAAHVYHACVHLVTGYLTCTERALQRELRTAHAECAPKQIAAWCVWRPGVQTIGFGLRVSKPLPRTHLQVDVVGS